MKNFIIVNTVGEFSCDCLEQIGSGTNELSVNINVGNVEMATIAIMVDGKFVSSKDLTANSENIISLSSGMIPSGEGVTTIEYVDDLHNSAFVLTLNFIENRDGEMIVRKVSEWEYNIVYIQKSNILKTHDCINNLESTATNLPLSANQGNKLNKSKGSVGNIDLTTCTTLQHILDWLSGHNCFYSGSTKLPAIFSPTGGINWFRCIWECHTGVLGNDGLTCIAKLNESIWYGYVTSDDSGNYVLKWNNLLGENLIRRYASGWTTSVKLDTKVNDAALIFSHAGDMWVMTHQSTGTSTVKSVDKTGDWIQVKEGTDGVTFSSKNGDSIRIIATIYPF